MQWKTLNQADQRKAHETGLEKLHTNQNKLAMFQFQRVKFALSLHLLYKLRLVMNHPVITVCNPTLPPQPSYFIIIATVACVYVCVWFGQVVTVAEGIKRSTGSGGVLCYLLSMSLIAACFFGSGWLSGERTKANHKELDTM